MVSYPTFDLRMKVVDISPIYVCSYRSIIINRLPSVMFVSHKYMNINVMSILKLGLLLCRISICVVSSRISSGSLKMPECRSVALLSFVNTRKDPNTWNHCSGIAVLPLVKCLIIKPFKCVVYLIQTFVRRIPCSSTYRCYSSWKNPCLW